MRHLTIAAITALALVGCTSDTSDRTTAAMDEMWSQRDERERAGFCAEVRLDLDGSIATFMDAEPEFDIVAVRDWLVDECDA